MKAAEYPQRTCREPVWNHSGMSYGCELPDRHPGPCASFSVKDSVAARDRYEEQHPDWEDQIGSSLDEV